MLRKPRVSAFVFMGCQMDYAMRISRELGINPNKVSNDGWFGDIQRAAAKCMPPAQLNAASAKRENRMTALSGPSALQTPCSQGLVRAH